MIIQLFLRIPRFVPLSVRVSLSARRRGATAHRVHEVVRGIEKDDHDVVKTYKAKTETLMPAPHEMDSIAPRVDIS